MVDPKKPAAPPPLIPRPRTAPPSPGAYRAPAPGPADSLSEASTELHDLGYTPIPSGSSLSPSPPTDPGQPLFETVPAVVASPASTLRLLGAWLVDVAAVLALVAVATRPFGYVGGAPASGTGFVSAVVGLTFVISIAWATAFAFVFKGRSPGRFVMGLRLVDLSGRAPSVSRAVIRGLLSGVSLLLCLAGYWLALVDARSQSLHDKLTRTFVVRLRSAGARD